jgi:hypothetical protein
MVVTDAHHDDGSCNHMQEIGEIHDCVKLLTVNLILHDNDGVVGG